MTTRSPAMVKQDNRDFLNTLGAPQVRALSSQLGIPGYSTQKVSALKTALLKQPELSAKRAQALKTR
jgi:hypothetical protein